MVRTSDDLVDCCNKNVIPGIPVLTDYFGFDCKTIKDIQIVLGVYQGLIKYKGVTSDQIHKALMENRLDELIHHHLKDHQTGYYKLFCKSGIKLNNNVYREM